MRAKQPVSLDGIEFDALMEITDSLEAESPEYPTEEGFTVNDTIIIKPRIISLAVYLSNTPITWRERFAGTENRVNEVKEKLCELYAKKKAVTLTTTDEIYENYCITSISFPRNVDTGADIEIPISLKEIRTTATKTTTIPSSYKRAGKTKKNAGTATTGDSKGIATSTSSASGKSSGSSDTTKNKAKEESKRNASVLYDLAEGTGLSKLLK